VILLPEITRREKIYSAFFESDIPQDLILIFIWLAACLFAIYLPFLNETPVRYVLSIPVVIFIPGYCLVSALFPKKDDIDLMERIALSFGLSIAIVPLIGLGLNFTPLGIRFEPLIIFLTIFNLVMILIAHYRRTLLPFEERFTIGFSAITGTIIKGFSPTKESTVNRLLNIILALVIVIAIITTIYVMVVPKEGEAFSEFYILNEKQKATDYPDHIIAGLNYPIYFGVGNQEFQNVTYTIETWFVRTEFDNTTNTSQIILMDPGDLMVLTLAHNETRIIPYNLSVKKPEYDRVEFLLFKGSAPGIDVNGGNRINASYRNLNLWVDVR
jgi:uncharacterized membrane protein